MTSSSAQRLGCRSTPSIQLRSYTTTPGFVRTAADGLGLAASLGLDSCKDSEPSPDTVLVVWYKNDISDYQGLLQASTIMHHSA